MPLDLTTMEGAQMSSQRNTSLSSAADKPASTRDPPLSVSVSMTRSMSRVISARASSLFDELVTGIPLLGLTVYFLISVISQFTGRNNTGTTQALPSSCSARANGSSVNEQYGDLK